MTNSDKAKYNQTQQKHKNVPPQPPHSVIKLDNILYWLVSIAEAGEVQPMIISDYMLKIR